MQFFLNVPATTPIYTLSLHDALPIFAIPLQRLPARQQRGPTVRRRVAGVHARARVARTGVGAGRPRSEEHTSELQSRQYLVCRLLLEKKKKRGQTRQCVEHYKGRQAD